MPGNSEEDVSAGPFNLPHGRFEAAVDALVQLRDSGRLLLFLSRRGSIKIICDDEEFRAEFAKRASDDKIDPDQSRQALEEIRKLISVLVRLSDPASAMDYLRRMHSDIDYLRKNRPNKEEFERRLMPKIEVVSNKIVTEAMQQRSKRLETSTGPCLEEVDFEVIGEREDRYRGRSIKDPFLRLRLRYTDGKADIGYLFAFGFDGPELPAPSFEIECDLSDIDLLIKRLGDAKHWLLNLKERRLGGEGE